VSLGVATGHEGDRVTTLELFFDLVFVFAFTQVTALMAHGEAPLSLLEAFIVLSLLWWSWCSYAWLANEARANRGVLRVAFIMAMVAMFVACLAIPEAFHEVPGGLSAGGTLVVCYAVVRLTHLTVYLVVAGEDRALRRQVLLTVATSVLPTLVALSAGVIIGGRAQTWIWLGAVLYDFAAIFLAARTGGGWAVRSTVHFAERHGLVVILALGESIVAIGAGLSEPLGWRVVVGSVLSIGIAIGYWWSYFPHLLGRLEAPGWRHRRAGSGSASRAISSRTSISRSSPASSSRRSASSRRWRTSPTRVSAPWVRGRSAVGSPSSSARHRPCYGGPGDRGSPPGPRRPSCCSPWRRCSTTRDL
jgi:low temperature requirement protein LtrA